MNFISKSLTRQLTLYVGLALFTLLSLCIAFITRMVNTSFTDISKNYLISTAERYGESTAKILTMEYNIAKTLQASLERYETHWN